MLAAILQQAGYKTGLYTSPHLKDFRERIRINGQMIRKEFVVDFVERTRAVSETIQPSFFELTVAMAFDYFANEQVDIAVIETGLGGRLDSTNVITPLVSVITNIGYDHMNLLGNTLAEIAGEKAGIIKEKVPVVIGGACLPETLHVFEEVAAARNAPLLLVKDKFSIDDIRADLLTLDCSITDRQNGSKENYRLDLNGFYQLGNLCTVLAAEGILIEKGFRISKEARKYALANTKQLTGLRGRWEVVYNEPLLVLDVGHNIDGIRQILQQIQLINPKNTFFIIGMVNDKDIDGVLAALPATANYFFSNAHIPRALPAAQLKEKAAAFGLQGEAVDDVNEAIERAWRLAGKHDLIIVCGSVFLVGEVETGAD